MSKRQNPIAAAASKNPSVVLRAFGADTEYTLTLDAWILLESIGSPYVCGGSLRMTDSIALLVAMTDPDALLAAKRKGPNAVEDLCLMVAGKRRPAELVALRKALEAAVNAALAPLDSGADPAEKKSSARAAGG